MKKITTAISVFSTLMLLHLTSSFGQGQANVWYMGNGAGLDFGCVPPCVMQDGNVGLYTFTGEGVGSISDANGNLLFYTNGNIVYNKNHVAMTNGTGLKGNGTTMQTGTIVPKIGSATQYYVITPADVDSSCRWSIVDMSLNGGLGDVVVASKNTMLQLHSSESCLVIPHSNGTDFWVILHASIANTFSVYPLTAAGFGAATTYNIGTFGQATMLMKANSCYNQIACVFYNQAKVEISSFNNTTGVISGAGLITVTGFTNPEVYGAEFSPSGRFLYVTESGLNTRKTIYQFDLQAGNSAAISASKRSFTNADAQIIRFGQLQLGPDAKIYCPAFANTNPCYMNVVPNPDVQWTSPTPTATEFLSEYIRFTSKLVGEGLPAINRNFLTVPQIVPSNVCQNGTTTLNLVFGSTMTTDSWTLGDGTTATNTSTVNHTYPNATSYTATVSVVDQCGNTRNGSKTFTINSGPDVTVPSNACPNTNVVLTGTGGNAASYTWSTSPSGSPVLGTGSTYTYNGPLPVTIYAQDATAAATYIAGNSIVPTPPASSAGSDLGDTYFEVFQTVILYSFQAYSRAAGVANFTIQNEGLTTTYGGPYPCNPGAAGQTLTITPNLTLAAGRYRLHTDTKTPFFREGTSADGGRDVKGVIDVAGEMNPGGLKGGLFENITVKIPNPCPIEGFPIIDGCGALPVELVSFEASPNNNNTVLLNWSTSSEINSNYFSVERSEDGTTFTSLGNVTAAGNSDVRKEYQFNDDNPPSKEIYYRLKQVDFDGTENYPGKVVLVNNQRVAVQIISPNPNDGNAFSLDLSSLTDKEALARVIDEQGKIVWSQFIDLRSFPKHLTINTNQHLNPGIYTIRLTSLSTQESQRFLVAQKTE